MRVTLLILLGLFIVAVLVAILGWMMVADLKEEKDTIIFRQKNLQDMCDDLSKENRNLADMIHRLSSLSEDTDKIIAKCLEILVGISLIESERQKNVNYFYVGDFNTLDKKKIWNFFLKFRDKDTEYDSMWWSRYAANESQLSKVTDRVSAEDACFICFKGVTKND